MFFKLESCIMLYFEVMSIFIHTSPSFFIQMFRPFHFEIPYLGDRSSCDLPKAIKIKLFERSLFIRLMTMFVTGTVPECEVIGHAFFICQLLYRDGW